MVAGLVVDRASRPSIGEANDQSESWLRLDRLIAARASYLNSQELDEKLSLPKDVRQ